MARAAHTRWLPMLGLLLVFAAPCLPALAAESPHPPLSADELDRSIDRVLQRPEYTWRMPRETAAATDLQSNVLVNFLREIAATVERWAEAAGKVLGKIWRWLRRAFERDDPAAETSELDWQDPVRGMLFSLLAVTCSVLAVTLYRLVRGRRRTASVVATAAAPRPDLRDENVTAELLPSDGWMAMARELLAQGDYRLAIRAMFLASLASLAEAGRLTLAASKSNRDYARELERRARDRAEALAAFRDTVGTIERIWYGRHEATADLATAFQSACERVIRAVAAPAATPAEGGPP